jgi:hypothetical protein
MPNKKQRQHNEKLNDSDESAKCKQEKLKEQSEELRETHNELRELAHENTNLRTELLLLKNKEAIETHEIEELRKQLRAVALTSNENDRQYHAMLENFKRRATGAEVMIYFLCLFVIYSLSYYVRQITQNGGGQLIQAISHVLSVTCVDIGGPCADWVVLVPIGWSHVPIWVVLVLK